LARRFIAALSAALAAGTATAQVSSPAWFPVPARAVYQTGDSWSNGGATYRLYGVQSCLRGTRFTNAHGVKRDCGEASLAMLAALVRDLRPQCYEAAKIPEHKTIFVFCVAIPSEGVGKGARIDLGTALIATGFAFAARTPDGRPVHAPYLVAERVAERSRAGLWVFADLPEPNAIILRRLQAGAYLSPAVQPTP
jgi:endonuclease YncB( thermonuclease family)